MPAVPAARDSECAFERVGSILKGRWAGWRAALLTAEAAPYKAIGLRPTRRIPLLNGSIPCRLLLFDLYSGSRREPRLEAKDEDGAVPGERGLTQA